MRRTLSVLAGLALQTAAYIPPAVGQGTGDRQLGAVHFDTSCNESAQRRFYGATRYSILWYRQSQEIFEEVLKADPQCAIAYRGIALSLLYHPHAPPPAENLPLGS